MVKKITITIGTAKLSATLNDSPSARALLDKLPLELRMSRWGDEYYGDCGLNVAEATDAREFMEVGELAVWPPGSALCVFFGPTPASTDERPRAASKVNPIGRVTLGLESLKTLARSIKAKVALAPA